MVSSSGALTSLQHPISSLWKGKEEREREVVLSARGNGMNIVVSWHLIIVVFFGGRGDVHHIVTLLSAYHIVICHKIMGAFLRLPRVVYY